MIRVVIVDDEGPNRDLLNRRLEKFDEDFDLLGEFKSGEDVLAFCENRQVDVVLLDINMPGMGGMEAARQLRQLKTPPVIIFCTGHNEYAVDAFEVEAAGFVTKPIDPAKLRQALIVAEKRLQSEREDDSEDALTIKTGRDLEKLPINQIMYCVAEQKYVTATHSKGEAVLDETLRQLEESHGDVFLRVHRNTLVARKQIQSMQKDAKGQVVLTLKDSDFSPVVSRRHIGDVKELF